MILLYCEQCGKKIDDDSKYCEFCGCKIKKEDSNNLTLKERRKNEHKNETKYLFLLLLFSIFGYIFYQELKYFNSPENAINHYLKDWKNKNYDSILNTLNIENEEFTSIEQFKNAFNEKHEFEISDYQISHCETVEEENAICYITYQTEKNDIQYEKKYKLIKNATNRLWIFTNWSIQNEEYLPLEEWHLYLPKDSIGKINNIDLLPYRSKEKDKTGYDCYVIPKIFKGTYELSIQLNNGMTVKNKVKIKNQKYSYQFSINDITEEFQAEIKKMGTEIIHTLYNGVVRQQKWEDLTSSYDIQKIKKNYETLKTEITKEINLKHFQIVEMKVIGLEINEEGKLYLSFQMNYDYTIEYQEGDKIKNHQGNSNDTFYLTMKNIDLKEVEKIDSLVSYFSKKY